MRKGQKPLVIARQSNVVRVDFGREPDPPAPRFPGAGAMRHSTWKDDVAACSVTLPWRGRVGERSEPGWGEPLIA
jgi:hypothetical protein